MADGRDDRSNYPPNRGAKLRNQGSNPTGSQRQSFDLYYSEDMDYNEGGMTHLNERTRMDTKNYSENRPKTPQKVRDKGLNLKQPL